MKEKLRCSLNYQELLALVRLEEIIFHLKASLTNALFLLPPGWLLSKIRQAS